MTSPRFAEGDRALEGLLDPEVGQLHLGVDGLAAAGVEEGGEGLAEQVVAFQLGVGERDHLRQERVGPHEPLQRVEEPVLLVLLEVGEPVDRRRQRGVDPTVVDLALGQQQRDRRSISSGQSTPNSSRSWRVS